MIFDVCYNANTKIGKAERNTKFIWRIIFTSDFPNREAQAIRRKIVCRKTSRKWQITEPKRQPCGKFNSFYYFCSEKSFRPHGKINDRLRESRGYVLE